ncbi:MAG: DUF1501 domain-containing protein [Lewinella sp.]
MIRLKGGNDGLNTFIPVHDFGTYRAKRPDIFIPESSTVKLTPSLAMHPQLGDLRPLWQEGGMRVLHSVGYEDQSLSHFRSSDIWATASEADEYVSSGVFGRYLQDAYPDFLTSPPATPPAIQIGGVGNLLFNNQDDFNYAISTSDPEQLYDIARSGQLYPMDDLPACTYGEQLGYLRAVANTTFRYAGVLAETYGRGRNDAEYQDDDLGRQLALVARLLRGGLETRLFVVELDGFDTHANQADDHAKRLQSVATNVSSFFADLATDGNDERVLAMTFSEFGRRVEQNGSQGTDHGAAAPMMVFGPALQNNATIGPPPTLDDTDDHGNLRAATDYRSVYATVLSRWLCIDDGLVDEVMGKRFPRLDALGLNCVSTSTAYQEQKLAGIGLSAYRSGTEIVVTYELAAAARVDVHLYDAVGRRVATGFRGEGQVGDNRHRIPGHLPDGIYIVTVETGGRGYSTRLPLF